MRVVAVVLSLALPVRLSFAFSQCHCRAVVFPSRSVLAGAAAVAILPSLSCAVVFALALSSLVQLLLLFHPHWRAVCFFLAFSPAFSSIAHARAHSHRCDAQQVELEVELPNYIVCQYEKAAHKRPHRWRFVLKVCWLGVQRVALADILRWRQSGVIHADGREFVFGSGTGDFDWKP